MSDFDKIDKLILEIEFLDMERNKLLNKCRQKIKELGKNPNSLHYCPEWDDLLICEFNPEFESCSCRLKK